MTAEETLISVEEAEKLVLSNLYSPTVEQVPLENSRGRVLASAVTADRDFPPFDRVMMDGIALTYEALNSGQRKFSVEGLQAAGDEQQSLRDPSNCLEIMTGAVLPKGCDLVIRYEDVSIVDGIAEVQVDQFKQFQNIHAKGMDQREGMTLIDAHQQIRAAEIAVLATVGLHKVPVLTIPRVLIVSTGDELVDVEVTPLPHQIRKSNVHALEATCEGLGLKTDRWHLQDDPTEISTSLERALLDYDVILLSGGVSKGKKDYLPGILDDLGVNKHFHRVKQRPGKPFWFGTRRSTVVFAFPGNPVSTYMCSMRYFVPWLQKSMGMEAPAPKAVLQEDFNFRPGLSYFLQVELRQSNGILEATPNTGQGSGDLVNLVETDAFLELPAERTNFEKGEVFPLWRFL